jgi:hypothetical protein
VSDVALEIKILYAAADIAERDHRAWKASNSRKCAKNDAGPLARELRIKAALRERKSAPRQGV